MNLVRVYENKKIKIVWCSANYNAAEGNWYIKMQLNNEYVCFACVRCDENYESWTVRYAAFMIQSQISKEYDINMNEIEECIARAFRHRRNF